MVATARTINFDSSIIPNDESYYNNNLNISKHNIGLSDKLIIEQIFEELKVLLEEFLANEQQALKNSQIFLDGIKQKFNAKLIIAELKKQKI